jgi:predicted DNA-binding protein
MGAKKEDKTYGVRLNPYWQKVIEEAAEKRRVPPTTFIREVITEHLSNNLYMEVKELRDDLSDVQEELRHVSELAKSAMSAIIDERKRLREEP